MNAFQDKFIFDLKNYICVFCTFDPKNLLVGSDKSERSLGKYARFPSQGGGLYVQPKFNCGVEPALTTS